MQTAVLIRNTLTCQEKQTDIDGLYEEVSGVGTEPVDDETCGEQQTDQADAHHGLSRREPIRKVV